MCREGARFMQFKADIMDERAMERAVTRIAHEIIERNKGTQDLVFLGVKRRGVPLARRMARMVSQIEQCEALPVGVAPVVARTVPLEVRALGTVTAAQTVTVQARLDGRLEALGFEEGQPVKRGQMLAQLDARAAQAAVEQMRKEYGVNV